MQFESHFFLFGFLPIVLLIYHSVGLSYKNIVALIASIIFYSWCAPLFVCVVFFAVTIDYFLAFKIAESTNQNKKKLWLLSISIHILLLSFFKYFQPALMSWFPDSNFTLLNEYPILLPAGISFFTFHEISYLTDVYRSTRKPFSSFTSYALYIFFFPQILAGPIIRFHEISEQIYNTSNRYKPELFIQGFFRFSLGLFKKLWISDSLSAISLPILNNGVIPAEYSFSASWEIALINLLWIYVDFSAYSDMAIGLAALMGFSFPENFNFPLIASSTTDYWKRWHMSLSRWFRDYLYHPLGGNKKGMSIMVLSILLVFTVSGIWHGAGLTYLFWGIGYGMIATSEKILKLDKAYSKYKVISVSITLVLVLVLTTLFSSKNIHVFLESAKYMFSFNSISWIKIFDFKTLFAIISTLSLAVFFPLVFSENLFTKIYNTSSSLSSLIAKFALSFILFSLSACLPFIQNFKPFLYYKF